MSASVSNGLNGGHHGSAPGHGRKGSARVLPHINDIQETPADANINMPIRTLLEKAESLLAESRAARDFNRPEQAFRAYLQASIITIKLVNSHPDFVRIQTDGSGLHRRHSTLLLRISEQHEAFAAIKQDIINNNRLHGTQPKKQRDFARPSQSPTPSLKLVHGKKEKPPVAPKPRELQSNRSSTGGSDDLAARFNKLGGPVSSPGQDPRIRTHPPIVPPRPDGLESDFGQSSGLPRPPAAIYMSPRGTVSEEAAALPTSTPGGLFSRTPSFPAGIRNQPSGSDYFPPAKTVVPAQKTTFTVPDGDKISVPALQQLVKAGAQVLFIDVRERDLYDSGHINAQFIICIEPSILRGSDMTAETLRERMAINPDAELELFDRRDTFDVVVLYDEDATEIPQYASEHNKKSALVVLKRVLYFLSVTQKTDPKLLEGGIDSWLDVFGPQCLVTTGTQRQPRKPVRAPLSGRPTVKYVPQTNVSDAALQALNEQLSSDVNFIRTKEDFFTKYPDVASEPQSMTGYKQPSAGKQHPISKIREPTYPGISDIPAAPTRPAPTVAKPNVSGLKPGEDAIVPGGPRSGSTTKSQKKMTGLYNPGNWCFANSSVQAMRMSPGFGAELSSKEWEKAWQIPKLPTEKGDHPRIMARIVANLFHWLNSGNLEEMKAQTLMEYSGALTRHLGPDANFSGKRQQDAQEFLNWLFDALSQETNTNRASPTPPPVRNPVLNGKSVLEMAVEWWNCHLQSSSSIIDKYWRFFEITSTQCDVCKNTTYMVELCDMLMVRPVGENVGPKTVLEALADDNHATIDDYVCDKCVKSRPATRRRRLGRMPDLLCVHIFAFAHGGAGSKIRKRLRWDLNNTNFGQSFIDPEDRQLPPGMTVDKHVEGPFNYECYAVLMHSGPSLHSGHYFTLVRDPSLTNPNQWYEFNDARVYPVGDIDKALFGNNGDRIPYMAFFRRKTGGLTR